MLLSDSFSEHLLTEYCQQGELQIEVGREKMKFVQGPFSTFCISALSGPYVPDITVLPSDVRCQYLCIHRDDYRRAIEVCFIIVLEMIR